MDFRSFHRMRRGYADLPLHGGKAPKWLFSRMVKLAREITLSIVINFGRDEFIKRISDPVWFQSFGCVLGFDWHSSGITTTVTGALKEGLKDVEREIGIFFAGGKGRRGIRTPKDIEAWGEKGFINFTTANELKKISRLVAKVDSHGLQDGFSIYHHFFIYTKDTKWAVIEQGMKKEGKFARRYHWLSDEIKSFVSDPHKGVVSERKEKPLNLIDSSIEATRKDIVKISKEISLKELDRIKDIKKIKFPYHHPIFFEDYDEKRLKNIVAKLKDLSLNNFEELLLVEGVGSKTLRALALLSHLIFGSDLSFKDPVSFSFAHGGKDGYPYPVDRRTYDESIEILRAAVEKAKLGYTEKMKALKKLSYL